jgi:hypothetical protein
VCRCSYCRASDLLQYYTWVRPCKGACSRASCFLPGEGGKRGHQERDICCPIKTLIDDIQQYLEREFLGQVRHTWWNEDVRAPVFEVCHETGRAHVNVGMGFISTRRDAGASLCITELADYMREARAQERCFLILEEEDGLYIRSTSL